MKLPDDFDFAKYLQVCSGRILDELCTMTIPCWIFVMVVIGIHAVVSRSACVALKSDAAAAVTDLFHRNDSSIGESFKQLKANCLFFFLIPNKWRSLEIRVS